MRKTLFLLVCVLATPLAMADEMQSRVAESRATTKMFLGKLKGELQKAMKAGGPVNAIQVCNEKAPKIAADVSAKKGWDVGRTSLKLRNQDNAPDAWEKQVLETFESRKAAGESPKTMEFSAVVSQGDGKVFRYMKAIPTGQVCVVCHGKTIAPPITAKLDELYPKDAARGFNLGDIRGAFTITQPM